MNSYATEVDNSGFRQGPMKVLVPATRQDLDPHGPSVSVVVPAMNEARNLPWLAAHMPANVAEIILVDGHSVDGTVDVARTLWPEVRVVTQTRRGKGNALACGFHAATADIIVMIDADGSMDPGEIPFFVNALRGGADYAKGSRFSAGGGSSDITRVRALGNRFLNVLTNRVHKTTYSDLCYGYNAFWRRVVPVLGLDPGAIDDDATERKWGDGFEVETLINIRVHTAGLRIAEVDSFESDRLHGVSNLNAVTDGLRVLRTIAVERRDLRAGLRMRQLAQTTMELDARQGQAQVDGGVPAPEDRKVERSTVSVAEVQHGMRDVDDLRVTEIDELDEPEVRANLIDLTTHEAKARTAARVVDPPAEMAG